MTLTMELTPEEQTLLQAAAELQGVDAQSVVRGLVASLPTAPQHTPTLGAQILAEWEQEGVLGMWQNRSNSVEYARELRAQAETRVSGT